MTTIEGTAVSASDYTVATTAESAPPVQASARAAEPGGVDLGMLDGSQERLEAGASVTSQEKLFEAITKAVIALVDLVVTVLSRSKTESAQARQRDSDSKVVKPHPGSTGSITKVPTAVIGPVKTSPTKRLEAIQDDRGVITVRTHDGYTVKAEGREEAWTITGPDGKATRIFGDPHVRESDGDKWDFKQRSSFMFGSSKVTVETVPVKNGNTLSSRITVYNGHDRVTIGGIDRNRPTILALASDGRHHDDGLSDGTIFTRSATQRGEAWSFLQNGKRKTMGAK